MSDQKKRLEEGPPIWVESLLSPQEYRETAKKFPGTFSNGLIATPFSETYHKGGKWRFEMGERFTPAQIKILNDRIEVLRKFIKEVV